ncbi:rRNA maturation RNase YbeY [Buchnera aphidicola]|uniref:rRNA maturation RNase YbeY n=1 Tax=Buchnera aphidicola TaxID=9 RepID=UPI0031B6A1FC
MTKIKINIQKVCKKKKFIPLKKDFQKWLSFLFKKKKIEITIRIVEKYEIKMLNFLYRKKNFPTNILSFSFNSFFKENNFCYLGDIIMCKSYLEQEAFKYKKNLKEHWAHLTIHATLHLLKYTHNTFESQKKMENLEIKLLSKLGYKNPY